MMNKLFQFWNDFLRCKVMSGVTFLILAGSLQFLIIHDIRAQSASIHSLNSSNVWTADSLEGGREIHDSLLWLNGGAGVGTEGVSAIISVSYQFDEKLVSVRASSTAEVIGDEYWDFAALFGRSSRKFRTHRSIAFGLGLVGGRVSDDNLFTDDIEDLPLTAGIAMEFQLFYRPTGFSGVGLYGFGNMNPHRPFAGISLALQIGRIR